MARSTVVSLSGWDGLAERAQVGPNTRGQREGDDVSFGSMLSKKSKIERHRKSRESRFLDTAAAARYSGANTKAGGLYELMWVLRSPRAKNFRTPPEKDFFDSIGQTRKWR